MTDKQYKYMVDKILEDYEKNKMTHNEARRILGLPPLGSIEEPETKTILVSAACNTDENSIENQKHMLAGTLGRELYRSGIVSVKEKIDDGVNDGLRYIFMGVEVVKQRSEQK